jgi:hypothetical protein
LHAPRATILANANEVENSNEDSSASAPRGFGSVRRRRVVGTAPPRTSRRARHAKATMRRGICIALVLLATATLARAQTDPCDAFTRACRERECAGREVLANDCVVTESGSKSRCACGPELGEGGVARPGARVVAGAGGKDASERDDGQVRASPAPRSTPHHSCFRQLAVAWRPAARAASASDHPRTSRRPSSR